MSYTKIKSINPSKNERGKWATIILLSAIVISCAWYFVFVPWSKDFKLVESTDVLSPGYHKVDKWPFVVRVEHDKCASLTNMGWYYDVEYHNVVTIPHGYVGVISGHKGVIQKPLEPGKYHLNLRQYDVTIINPKKQEYQFVK